MAKKPKPIPAEMRLYAPDGQRLYVTQDERAAFIDAARKIDPVDLALCEVLHHTGCRVSETLEIIPERVLLDEGRIVLRSLKKRRQDVYRSVPVPPECIDGLERTFSIRKAQRQARKRKQPLFPVSRVRVWQIVKEVMRAADIAPGPHQTPKGLRHGYGINAVLKGVPITSLQTYMGHADLSTTAIYLQFVGNDDAEIAARMWS